MNQEPESSTPCGCGAPACESPKSTRREFMLKIGFAMNAVAGAAVGIPLLGYVLSSFLKPPSSTG